MPTSNPGLGRAPLEYAGEPYPYSASLTGTPTTENDGAASPSGDTASTQGDGAMGEPELPPPADVGVVGANV